MYGIREKDARTGALELLSQFEVFNNYSCKSIFAMIGLTLMPKVFHKTSSYCTMEQNIVIQYSENLQH